LKKQELNDCFKRTCEFYIDFSNGYEIQDEYENLDPSCIIGVRLFHYALVDNVSFKKFLSDNKKLVNEGLFDIEEVLKEISKVYRPLLEIDKEDPLPIVVILDEFQFTFEQIAELKENNAWKEIAISLVNYMCNSSKANDALKRDQLLLLTTIAGTLTNAEVSFKMTHFPPAYFPVPSFPLETALKLAREVRIPKEYLDEKNTEFMRFWYLMGLVPRCLEYSCTAILESKHKNMTAEQLFNLALTKLHDIYAMNSKYTDQDQKLLQYTMTGVNVQPDEWIQGLQSAGKIFLQGEKILLPHPVFYKLTIRHALILPTSLIHISKEMFNWYTFKKLDMHILAQRRAFATTIGELFPGAHGDESIKNQDIHVYDNVRYLEETTNYVDGTKANPTVSAATTSIDTKRGAIMDAIETFVFQAKKNQVLIDGRLFITGTRGEKIVCFLQYEYSEIPEVDKEEQVKTPPLAWYKATAPAIKEQYKDYLVVFVYITNAHIPKKAKEAVAECQNLVVIEQSCAKDYFAPNVLPFYSTVEGTPSVTTSLDNKV